AVPSLVHRRVRRGRVAGPRRRAAHFQGDEAEGGRAQGRPGQVDAREAARIAERGEGVVAPLEGAVRVDEFKPETAGLRSQHENPVRSGPLPPSAVDPREGEADDTSRL